MGVTYEPADDEVKELVISMRDKYHHTLRDLGVKIDCLMAHGPTDEDGTPVGPAVKLHGYPCAATIRIIGLRDRSKGMGDAEIVIDGDSWDTWSVREREALIDHELQHLDPVVDGDGIHVRDDLGRPKLRMNKHDHQFGWFTAIAERHGRHSFEVKQAQALFVGDDGQIYFPFVDRPDAKEKVERFLAGSTAA